MNEIDRPDGPGAAVRDIGLPAMLRGSYALGSIVRTKADIEEALRRAFSTCSS